MRQLPPEVLFDKRLVERHIAQGLCTKEDAEKFATDSKDATELSELMDLDELMASPTK